MLYAYLTHDEVNQDLAKKLAAEMDVDVYVFCLRDACKAGQFDAVLYDLDALPPDTRLMLLADLGARRRRRPIAVHSHNLSDQQERALRRQGVIVTKRLRLEVIARLRDVVDARRGLEVAA